MKITILKYLISLFMFLSILFCISTLNVHAASQYEFITTIIYTSDMSFENAVNNAKPYLITKNGVYCDEEYNITFKQGTNGFCSYVGYYPDGSKFSLMSNPTVVDSTIGSYIMGIDISSSYAFIYVKELHSNFKVSDCFKEGWYSRFPGVFTPNFDNNNVVSPMDSIVVNKTTYYPTSVDKPEIFKYVALSDVINTQESKPNIDGEISKPNIDSNNSNPNNNESEITPSPNIPAPNIPGQNLPGQNSVSPLTNFFLSPLGAAILCAGIIILVSLSFKVWNVIKSLFNWLIE